MYAFSEHVLANGPGNATRMPTDAETEGLSQRLTAAGITLWGPATDAEVSEAFELNQRMDLNSLRAAYPVPATDAEISEATVVNLTIDLDNLRAVSADQAGTIRLLTDRVTDTRNLVVSADRRHVADVELIGEALLVQADERKFCEDFDHFVAGLNRRLSVPLPVRSQDFMVHASVSVSFTVTATNEDDARRQADTVMGDVESAIDYQTSATAGSWDFDSVEAEDSDY